MKKYLFLQKDPSPFIDVRMRGVLADIADYHHGGPFWADCWIIPIAITTAKGNGDGD